MAVHGKSSYIALDNAAGTPVVMSSDNNQVGLSRSLDTAESTGFGAVAKSYLAGLEDATASFSGFFTPAQDAVLSAVVDALAAGTIASVTLTYGPEGNASGKVKYDQEVIVTSYEVTGSVGDLVSANVSLQRTGASTRGAFS